MGARTIRDESGTAKTTLFAMAAGLGLLAYWQSNALVHGGLAPLAIAAVIGAFVGLPLATAGWEMGRPGSSAGVLERSWSFMADLWSVLLIAALCAPLVGAHGWRGALGAGLTWLVAAVVMKTGGNRVLMPLAACTWLATAVFGGASLAASPWTALEPQWHTWQQWMPTAIVGSILLTGAGMGTWAVAPHPVPGKRRIPWSSASLLLLAALALSVGRAAQWEAVGIAGNEGTGAGLLLTLAGLSVAGCALIVRAAHTRRILVGATTGWLLTCWFAWPAAASLDLWWNSLLPLAPALLGLAVAVRSTGGRRWLGILAAAIFGLAVVLGWPGLPEQPLDAAAAAVVPVLAVWYIGTRAALTADDDGGDS